MGPGVRGPRGLPAVPIVCNLDVGTVIILNLQMGDDTARAMIWPAETVPVACVNVSYMLNKVLYLLLQPWNKPFGNLEMNKIICIQNRFHI